MSNNFGVSTKFQIFNYRNPSEGTRRCNAIAVKLGKLTLYFSYSTVVAFKVEDKLYVSENCFSQTTAQHIRAVESYEGQANGNRLPREIFEETLAQHLAERGI